MTKEKIDQNLILKPTFDFSLLIIDFCEKLETARKYIIARQLLKSGSEPKIRTFANQLISKFSYATLSPQ